MKILVTAFGPFQEFKDNPSNLVMNYLKSNLSNNLNCIVDWQTIEVSYSNVDNFVNKIIQENYDFIIHLGVATNDPIMRLELVAKNECVGKDVNGIEPEKKIIKSGAISLTTTFDNKILEFVRTKYSDKVRFSEDAGSYLCNYIFYKSLQNYGDKSSILFIHIADFHNISNAVSLEEQSHILSDLIVNCI